MLHSPYIRSLLFFVELQQLYRRCYTVYTFPTFPCGDTVALQEMLHGLYVSYYSLQSYSSSTGDATQSIHFLLFPVEMLHSLYVPCRATVALQEMLHSLYVSQSYWRCYPVYTFPTIPCRATVALQEMLHSLYVSYYSLQSYCSSTGDATQSIRFLLFPVELQQLYRRCYTAYTFNSLQSYSSSRGLYVSYYSLQSCSSSMLHSLYISYYSLQSYRRCYTVCRSTVALQEMLQQLYRRCYAVCTFPTFPCGDTVAPVEPQQLYRRCYTVYTFPTIPCSATVALQEMLHTLQVSYYSLQSHSSSTGDATQSIRFLLLPIERQQLYRRCYTVYTFPTIPCRDATQPIRSLQSYSSPTGDATQSIRFLLFPLELQQLDATQSKHFLLFPVELQQHYTRCNTVCRSTVALQEMLHSLYVSYYSLQSKSRSTGDATQPIRFLLFPVEIQQLYRRCYTVYMFPTIPCRATVALQEMHATQSIRFLLFPLELQQLYRRCMLHSLYVSYYSLQSYSSSTRNATQSERFLLFPVELQQLYRRCYTVYTFLFYSLQSYSSSTGDATPSMRFLLFPVELQQLYRSMCECCRTFYVLREY